MRTHLEAEDAEKMRPPDKLEPYSDDLSPSRSVLRHAPSGKTGQRLDPLTDRRGGKGEGTRVLQLAIIHPK